MVQLGIPQQLDAICSKVEQMFRDTSHWSATKVLCAYRGFAEPRPPADDIGVVLEVFFAPPGSARQIMRATHADREQLGASYNMLVSIVVHYIDDTMIYYLDDVFAVLGSRGEAFVLDPGAFSCQTVHKKSLGLGTVSSGTYGEQAFVRTEQRVSRAPVLAA